MFRFLNQAAGVQHLRRDLFVSVEVLVQGREADFEPALLEDVRKAALGQAAMKRHLAAFETDLARVTRAGLLSLLTAAGGFSQTRSGPAADAFLFVSRSLCRFKCIKTNSHYFLL